jgi:S1-C subfamily serine protease
MTSVLQRALHLLNNLVRSDRVNARIGILTGTRAGESIALSKSSLTVGRHPEVDLRFDANVERSVSGRHALLFQRSGRWYVRDLDSRNGTQLNGHPITGETPLTDGDRLTFGVNGPTVMFTTDATVVAMPAVGGTKERLRTRIRHSRMMAGGAMMLLVTGVGGLMALGMRREAAWNLERSSMQVQIDSLQWAGERSVEALEQQLLDVTTSLERSRERVQSLEVELASAESRGNPARDEVQRLRRELQRAMTSFEGQQTASTLDFRSIQDQNRRAVARIYVEYDTGEVVTATAFAVRSNATLVTSRHVVSGENGRMQPRRIAIQFSDSDQIWPARLLGSAPDADLAVVKVDNILGAIPTVRGMNLRPDTLAAGAPVAMLGYPLGGAPADNGADDGIARPYLAAGVVRSVQPDRMEVEGYGAVGASGSPIFDARGEVVAVVFGGREEDDSHALFGVPAPAAIRLLSLLP